MDQITKKTLEKHFRKVYKKSFRKTIQKQVKAIAEEKLGDKGADRIVIDDISIEITNTPPAGMTESGNPVNKKKKRCFWYCYVRNGERICRKIRYKR